MAKEYAGKNKYAPQDSLDWLLEELGKHTESMADKAAVQHQMDIKQMQRDKAEHEQIQEKLIQEKIQDK